jgi:hypothetical protein
MKVRHVRTIPRQTPLLRNRHQKWTAHPRTTNPRDRVIHHRVGSVGLSNSTSGAHHEERGDAVDVGVAEGVAQIGPIEASICRHVVGSSKPFVVDDARARLAIASAQSAADALRLAAEAELKSATARAASDANAALLNRSIALAQQVFEALRDQPASRTRHLEAGNAPPSSTAPG